MFDCRSYLFQQEWYLGEYQIAELTMPWEMALVWGSYWIPKRRAAKGGFVEDPYAMLNHKYKGSEEVRKVH